MTCALAGRGSARDLCRLASARCLRFKKNTCFTMSPTMSSASDYRL